MRNFITIRQLLATEDFGGRKWTGDVLRLAMLRTHYRQPIDWTVRGLDEAQKTLDNWADLVARHKITSATPTPQASVVEALLDDLNTAAAFAALAELAKAARHDYSAAQNLANTATWLGFRTETWIARAGEAAGDNLDPAFKAQVEALVAARLEARAQKNFAESDRLRDELAALGVQLKDGKGANGEAVTTWEVKA